MITVQSIIEKAQKYNPKVDVSLLERAYDFALNAHEGQVRYSGEPYIIHPLGATDILMDFHPDEETIVAMLLHDVSEDTPRTLKDIEVEFGKTVRTLVDGMEKLGRVKSYGDDSQIANLQKMFLAMGKDMRVVLMKLCDRMHNISTLKFVPEDKQKRIARETIQIYAPIASRLGIYKLKTQLEDESFKFLDPALYASIDWELKRSGKDRKEHIKVAKEQLEKILSEEGLRAEVDGRMKSIYSIYRKMQRKRKDSVDEVFDIFAMRIIMPDINKHGKEFVGHLYTALGVIHNRFTPLAHRFKDYVAVPKVNDYRSLHTTVMGLGSASNNQPTEVQIRTQTMHEQADLGVASHWIYDDAKSSKGNSNIISKSHIDWLQGLSELRKEVNNEDFLKGLEIDIFSDRIFVFTPRGDVKDLPRGAIVLDFAYAVHTEVGNKVHQVKVNGNMVPLNYELKNGEVVEVITRKNAVPKRSWLSLAKTNLAKSRIRAYFRDQNRDENLKRGREIVNEYLKKFGRSPLSPTLSVLRDIGGKRLSMPDREEVLIEVGKGTLYPSTLMRKLFTFEDIVKAKSQNTANGYDGNKSARAKKRISANNVRYKVLVAGHPNLPLHLANCCGPKKDSPIIAFITREKGVSIHSSECRVLKKLPASRKQAAHWVEAEPRGRDYIVPVMTVAENKPGVLRDIAETISRLGFNIEDVSTSYHNGLAHTSVSIKVHSYEDLEKILMQLELVQFVKSAYLE
jgi:GTP diphosphokinase / guanosine-3',5'-bis(diphosphate) 3'-diphosphatase